MNWFLRLLLSTTAHSAGIKRGHFELTLCNVDRIFLNGISLEIVHHFELVLFKMEYFSMSKKVLRRHMKWFNFEIFVKWCRLEGDNLHGSGVERNPCQFGFIQLWICLKLRSSRSASNRPLRATVAAWAKTAAASKWPLCATWALLFWHTWPAAANWTLL